MNKSILALSTALSIFAFTPAFAQEQAAPAVDCTQQANANDPACMNKNNTQQNTNGQTQTQSGTSTTDQNAQGTTTTTTDQNAQGTTGTTTDTTTTTTTTDSSSGAGTTTQQMSGELIVPADQLNSAKLMSANDYIGKTVYDQTGANIGEVNDLIVSGDGNVEAVILGVGGFLGIGEKDVAVNTNAIQMVQDGNSNRLVVQATKEALEAAPSYDRTNRRYATDNNANTTDTTGSTTAPATNADGTQTNMNNNATGTGTVDCSLAANANDPACANKTQQ